VRTVASTCSDERVRVVGLRAADRAWLWLFNREASWNKSVVEAKTPHPVSGAQLVLTDVPTGSFEVTWTDPWTGETLESAKATAEADGALRIRAPNFQRDIAARIRPTTAR
jgi:hypothetical protein